jgi:hypothetical protein
MDHPANDAIAHPHAASHGPAKTAGARHDAGLLDRIMRHDLDRTDVSLPFSERLARENGWPQDFAHRVIHEYKRFVYLACLSSDELTPSDEVDQAWHLHLAYSRDYWDVFCPQVLGRSLHHGPTRGGLAEAERFQSNYLKTLTFYETVFGEKPPRDIWPPPSIRFAAPDKFRRVNLGLFSLKPRTEVQGRPPLALIALILFVSVLLLRFSLGYTTNLFSDIFSTIILTAILYPLCIMLYVFLRRGVRARRTRKSEKIQQTQHGFTITYTIGIGTGAAIAYSVDVSGSGDSDSSDSSSDGGDSGCGGCGGD